MHKKHKNTFTKCLLWFSADGDRMHKYKEVSKYAPINRVLDEVGMYDLDSIEIQDHVYLIVTKKEERHTNKSILLIQGISKDKQGLRDLTEEDEAYYDIIAEKYLKRMDHHSA